MNTDNWTTNNIPSLDGKIIIVTGGNSGLGFQSVKAYAEKGAKVIMACRSAEKGSIAKFSILRSLPNAAIELMELDLMSLNSIRNFANNFKAKYKTLDILLNNAGIMMTPYNLTVDGIESQQATNHFGHFALTALLLDVLKNTPKSRVVNVSSMAHRQGVFNADNLLFEGGLGYTPMKAYGLSKLENLLFTYELQRYFEKNNIDCMAVVAHPGVSDTNLFSHIGGKFLQTIMKPLFSFMVQAAEMGALPQLRASVDAYTKGGDFYGPKGRNEMKGYPVIVQPKIAAKNEQDAKKLWEISEKITGVKF